MPSYLKGECFEGWFDYEPDGEQTNTVVEYQLNTFVTPAEAQHCATAGPPSGGRCVVRSVVPRRVIRAPTASITKPPTIPSATADTGVFCAPSAEPAPSAWLDDLGPPDWNTSVSPPGYTETLVVGAGMTGCSIAYHLSEAGVECTVVDARSVAEGASGRNGGILWPSKGYEERTAAALVDFIKAKSVACELSEAGGVNLVTGKAGEGSHAAVSADGDATAQAEVRC